MLLALVNLLDKEKQRKVSNVCVFDVFDVAKKSNNHRQLKAQSHDRFVCHLFVLSS